MVTSNKVFTKLNDRTINYLEDLWSEIVVTFIFRKRQTIEYKTKLTTKASTTEYIYRYFPQNKMNLFILSGHAGDSFAAFLNEVIL